METLKNLGNNIAKLRKKAGITQERLAEKIGVSVSAVSQWESGKTMPDICTIPILCHVLNVSSDELLEINREKDETEIRKIDDEANKLMQRARYEEAERMLIEAYRRFPGSYELMTTMMFLYYNMAFVNRRFGGQETTKGENYFHKSIDFAQKILDGCRDSLSLNSAKHILCLSYSFLGEDDKAVAIAREMPAMSVSRESLLSIVSKDRDRFGFRQREMLLHVNSLCLLLVACNMKFHDGSFAYTLEEEAALAQKSIDLLHVLFEDEDFGFFHNVLMNAHFHIARIVAGNKKDREETLSHLNAAATHGEAFLKNEEGKVYTSLFLRGREIGAFSTNDKNNSTAFLLENLKEDCFDFIREEPEYRTLVKRLKKTAGTW